MSTNFSTPIRIGARGSKLSLTQSEWVAARLREAYPGLNVELVVIQTTGDKLRDVSLTILGGLGVFTKEIERALLNDEIDIAVHSLKDLPTTQPEELQLAAVTTREDPRDCLVAAGPIDLRAEGQAGKPAPLVIGTSSLRRQAQLLRLNPNLQMIELRGNVPTRIEKMKKGEMAGIVLAAAGLSRLGIDPPWMRHFSFDEMLPAPGQGALGLEIRANDDYARQIVSILNDPNAYAACVAERAFLRAFGGGCRAPIAALGTVEGKRLGLDGMIASADAREYYREQLEGDVQNAETIGDQLARSLMERGARILVPDVARETKAKVDLPDAEEIDKGKPLRGRRIVVTRDEDADGPLSSALRDQGAEPLLFPVIAEAPPADPAPLRQAILDIERYDWIVFSSVRSVHALSKAMKAEKKDLAAVETKVACIGPRTAQAFADACEGTRVADVIATLAGAEGLVNEFASREPLAGKRVLYPRSEQALPGLREGLERLGATVVDPVAYRTTHGRSFEDIARQVENAQCDAITFASPSAVDFFIEAMGTEKSAALSQRVVFASIGPTTSEAMRRHGLRIAVEASERSFVGLAQALADIL